VGFPRTATGMTAGKNPRPNKFNLIEVQPIIAGWTATPFRPDCQIRNYGDYNYKYRSMRISLENNIFLRSKVLTYENSIGAS
jgi:hypothetical protein